MTIFSKATAPVIQDSNNGKQWTWKPAPGSSTPTWQQTSGSSGSVGQTVGSLPKGTSGQGFVANTNSVSWTSGNVQNTYVSSVSSSYSIGNSYTTDAIIERQAKMSDTIPAITFSDYDENGSRMNLVLNPEYSISAIDSMKISSMMFYISMVPQYHHEFSVLKYVRKHNLEKHFKFVQSA